MIENTVLWSLSNYRCNKTKTIRRVWNFDFVPRSMQRSESLASWRSVTLYFVMNPFAKFKFEFIQNRNWSLRLHWMNKNFHKNIWYAHNWTQTFRAFSSQLPFPQPEFRFNPNPFYTHRFLYKIKLKFPRVGAESYRKVGDDRAFLGLDWSTKRARHRAENKTPKTRRIMTNGK